MNNLVAFLIAGMLSIVCADLHYDPSTLVETCDSQIYCYGPLLDTVQMAQLFSDSKTFADMKLKLSPAETLAKFQQFKADFPNPTNANIAAFVQGSFDTIGLEYEPWVPTDSTTNPAFLSKITDPDYRALGLSVNNIWPLLGRKMTADVAANPDLYSVIPIDNPVIVPGGRFREFYYWDSYWVIKGLLISEMFVTAKGMLENFGSLVDRFGFIPNGGRIYYLGRSQPPLYIPMVEEYFDATQDKQFITDNIAFMEKEFNFWLTNRTLVVNGFRLGAYGENTLGPRPESYREDIATAANVASAADKQIHYSQIKAAAESGMDFSSRWCIDGDTNLGTLADLQTRSIVPVDLNAYLFHNAKVLARFYKLLGQTDKVKQYNKIAKQWKAAITAVFWDEDVGIWLDWDLVNNHRRNYFVASNLVPLWAKAYDNSNKVAISAKVINYITQQGLKRHPGGIPNSLQLSDEQWDFPNIWPPMMFMTIAGLAQLGTPEATALAYDFASKLVYDNYIGFKTTTAMFEKYDAETAGAYGGGGEYNVQFGFGWSNGVLLYLLNTYGDKLSVSEGQSVAAILTAAGSPGPAVVNHHNPPAGPAAQPTYVQILMSLHYKIPFS